MKKDQVIILEKRGTILISGDDATNFLQNTITNDIKKVSKKNSLFAALLTPQGKYLNEFFVIKDDKGFQTAAKILQMNLSKIYQNIN